jgi:hypothetical protein
MQNLSIGMSIAASIFQGDELSKAMFVPLMYGLAEMVFIGLYCICVWKLGMTKAPANESFLRILAHSYEVDDIPRANAKGSTDEESTVTTAKSESPLL